MSHLGCMLGCEQRGNLWLYAYRLQDPADPQTARLWVRYSSGLEAPLEPQVSAGYIGGLG